MLVNVAKGRGVSSMFSRDSMKLSLDRGVDVSVLSISPVSKRIFGLSFVQSDTLSMVALMALPSRGNVMCF